MVQGNGAAIEPVYVATAGFMECATTATVTAHYQNVRALGNDYDGPRRNQPHHQRSEQLHDDGSLRIPTPRTLVAGEES